MPVTSVSDGPGCSAQHAEAKPTEMQLYLQQMGRNGQKFMEKVRADQAVSRLHKDDQLAHGETRLRSANGS